MKITVETSDVGYAIRDALEGKNITQEAVMPIVKIDTHDPNNLVMALGNGQEFTIRIVAK